MVEIEKRKITIFDANPKISVVMPVYNGEKYLAEAIESILAQTFIDYEFIIVNDGSTDNTLNIIEEYMQKDNRIKVIKLKKVGLVNSLNIGIELAKGEYIARMDADDISMPERFQKQVDYLDENYKISILATYIEAIGYDKERKLKLEDWFNNTINTDNQLERIIRNCPIAHPSVMMRSDFAKKEKYSLGYQAMEDYELWMRAVNKGYKIRVVEEKLLHYRFYDESKSATDNVERLVKQRVSAKIKYFFPEGKNRVIIWGLGERGQILLEYMRSNEAFKDIEIVAIVDKKMTGFLQGYEIKEPGGIDTMDFDYVFIVTSLGYDDISEYMKNKGKVIVKDYMYII